MTYTQKEKFAAFLLRVGLGGVFLYAAVSSFLDPSSWIGFLPKFLSDVASLKFLLGLFSVYEILLALWLISGKETMVAAILSAATMFAIIVQNLGALDILFRDVALFFAALALAVLTCVTKEKGRPHQSAKLEI